MKNVDIDAIIPENILFLFTLGSSPCPENIEYINKKKAIIVNAKNITGNIIAANVIDLYFS
jgi:hypothetical protein